MLTTFSQGQWRGVPLAKLALLLAGPLLFNTVELMSFFALNLQGVHLELPPRTLALIAVAFAVGYTVASLVSGHLCRPRHAGRLLTAALLFMGVAATLSRFAATLPQLVGMALMLGTAAGSYFAPFQILMGNVRPFRTMAWTVAFYNVSWGTGVACGPLLTSGFRSLAPAWCITLAWLILGAHLLLLRTALHAPPPATPVAPGQGEPPFASSPEQRRSGWVAVLFASILVACTTSTLWPALGKMRAFPDWKIACGVTVIGSSIVLGACLWARLRRYLGHPAFLAGLLVEGALGYLLLPFTSSWIGAMASLLLTGVAVSGIFFIAVYFVNTDPESQGRSVGINEAVVGSGNILGPLLLGVLAWNDPGALRPYLFIAVLMLAAAVVVFRYQRRPHVPGQ